MSLQIGPPAPVTCKLAQRGSQWAPSRTASAEALATSHSLLLTHPLGSGTSRLPCDHFPTLGKAALLPFKHVQQEREFIGQQGILLRFGGADPMPRLLLHAQHHWSARGRRGLKASGHLHRLPHGHARVI
jgi:hypothetical protein